MLLRSPMNRRRPMQVPTAQAFLPSDLENLELWTRFNQGITVTGAGVSQWDDQSGNGNHLLQGTDTNRPALQGDGSVLFDGVDNYLQAIFALSQPLTIYVRGKQITHTASDMLWGDAGTSMYVQQTGTSPQITLNGAVAANTDFVLNTYATLAAVWNSTSSLLQVNNETPTTGDAGASAFAGITLGARGNATFFSNIQVKEVAAYSADHDAATRAQVIAHLNSL